MEGLCSQAFAGRGCRRALHPSNGQLIGAESSESSQHFHKELSGLFQEAWGAGPNTAGSRQGGMGEERWGDAAASLWSDIRTNDHGSIRAVYL